MSRSWRNWRSSLLQQTLSTEETKATFENITRVIRSEDLKRTRKVEVARRTEAPPPVSEQTPDIKPEVFVVNKILRERLKKFKAYYDIHPYLAKTSVMPEHLTILDAAFAQETANTILNNRNKASKTFIEFQPGIGLVAEQILRSEEAKGSIKNVLLLEPRRNFLPDLSEVKKRATTYNVQVVKTEPFKSNFTTMPYARYFDESPVTVFGTLPWTLQQGIMRTLYESFSFSTSFFSHKHNPEFYFYVPEHVVARLQPEQQEAFLPFNSALSVYSAILSQVDVLLETSCEQFNPYPLMKPIDVDRQLAFPLDLMDFRKMYLIRVNFDVEPLIQKEQRGVFFEFVHRLWSQPKLSVSEAIKCSILQAKHVQELKTNVSFNFEKPIRQMHALEFYELFNFISQREHLMTLIKMHEKRPLL